MGGERERLVVADLLSAIRGHRRHQYLKIADWRGGTRDSRAAREARYEARSRMEDAVDRLVLLVDNAAVIAAAEEAVRAAIAVGDLPYTTPNYEARLAELGDRAREAHTHLRQTAATNLEGDHHG